MDELTTDDVVRLTRVDKDDKAFVEERRRSRKRFAGPEESERCCETCRHWIVPTADETATAKKRRRPPYGRCRKAMVGKHLHRSDGAVLTMKEMAKLERDDDPRLETWKWELLRTTAGYDCSQHEEAA
jgi:hypothetical protein